MKLSKRGVFIAGAILIAFVAGLLVARPARIAIRMIEQQIAPEVTVVGESLPLIPARDAGGTAFDGVIANVSGTQILLFWSVSCSYCSNMLTTLTEVEQETGMELPITLVTVDPKAAIAGCILLTSGYRWSNYVIEGTEQEIDRFREEWDLFAVPSIWIVDENQIIVDRLRGYNERGVREYFSDFAQ